MRNLKSGDALRRLYMLVVYAVMILFCSGMILYVLNKIYNLEFRTQLYLRGHIFVMALYIGVFLFLGRLFLISSFILLLCSCPINFRMSDRFVWYLFCSCCFRLFGQEYPAISIPGNSNPMMYSLYTAGIR